MPLQPNMRLKFSATTRKWGSSVITTIPAAYLRTGLIQRGKKYLFTIQEYIPAKNERSLPKIMPASTEPKQ